MMDSWKKNLTFIWIAQLLAVTGFGTSNPIIPFYVQALGVTDPQAVKIWAGAIQTGGSLSVAVFAPIWGRLGDRFGRRPMFLRALFGGSVMMLFMGLATRPWQLLLFRSLGGMFTGTVAAATVLVATSVPRERAGHSLGLLHAAILIGSSLGPVLGGTLSDFLGFRAVYYVTSALLLAAALIVVKYVKEDFSPQPSSLPWWKSIVPDFSPVAGSRELLCLVIVVGAVQLGNSALVPVLPLFIRSLAPATALIGSVSGFIIGMRALAGAGAAATSGRLAARLGTRAVLLACMLGGACAHLPLVFVRTTSQLLVLRLAAGVFLGGAIPAVNALIAARARQGRQGAIYGISSSVSSAGSATGPMVGAGLAAALGYGPVFIAITIVLLAAAALVYLNIPAGKGHSANVSS